MTNTFKELEFDENSNIKPQKKKNHTNNKHVYKTFIKHSTNPFFVVVMIANSPT